MMPYLIPLAFAVIVWWLSTGTALLLVRRSLRTYGWTMAGTTLVLLVALTAAWITRDKADVAGAYIGFICALGVWTWSEMSFLMGYVTGPVGHDCPTDAKGWRRFSLAAGTVLYHELAIVIGGALLLAVTWGAENQVAAWTYAVLFIMRLSAKLNVFFGVANLAEDFLPAHLNHLKSYFGRPSITPFFGVSVTIGTVMTALVFHAAQGEPYQIAAAMLTGTLMALALLEHWLLVLPISDAALWSWASGPRSNRNTAADAAKPAPTLWGTKRVGG